MKRKLFLLPVLALSVFSCKKENNAGNPKIEVTVNRDVVTMELCGHTEKNVIEVAPGDTLILTTHIEGDNELSQLRIDIHDAGDCHSHERPAAEWSYHKIVDLASKHVERRDTIIVPMDSEHHNHHMSLKVLDKEGLSSDEVEFNVLVEE